MRKKTGILLVILLLCLLAGSAPRSAAAAPAVSSGGPYVLDWWSVDGGGGQSIGGIYILTGTIGQFDAGEQAVGPYQLRGGFWARLGSYRLNLPFISRNP
jgi:hypothetical protein